MAPMSPCLPSLLLATRITGLLARRAKSAKARSFGVRPARASTTNIKASARPIAVSVCSCIRAVSEPFSPLSSPAVSMTVNCRSPSRPAPSRRSRVTPGSSSTSASFCPTRRLNSVDFPTLGRPIMAIVKGICDQEVRGMEIGAALLRRPTTPGRHSPSFRQRSIEQRLARECTARQRSREWRRRRLLGRLSSRGRLRRRGGGLIGRRRGGPLTDDFLLGSRRRCRGGVLLGRGRGVGAGGVRLRLALGFRGALQFGFRRRRRRNGGSGCLSVLISLLLRVLVKGLRNALFEARHTLRKYLLALAGQLLLGIHPVEPVHRIEARKLVRAAGHRARKCDEDRSGDQTLQATHCRFSFNTFPVVSSRRQLLATGGSSACSASARERIACGVSPSLTIMSSHCRAAVVSLARQADKASNSRAVCRKVAPALVAGSRRCSMLG